jgi:AcrR family transcriptional regulator
VPGTLAAGRRGRPRASDRPRSGLEPRDEILEAAARLFTTVGYAGTTTRMVAEAVGLRQASLFHHFAHKEDLLAELLDRTIRLPLASARELDRLGLRPAVALHRLVLADAGNLCGGEHNLGALQLLPEVRAPRFDGFWADRHRLWKGYRRRLAAGDRDGTLVVDDLRTTTDLVFSLVEGTITWFALRLVLPDPAELPSVRAESLGLDAAGPR